MPPNTGRSTARGVKSSKRGEAKPTKKEKREAHIDEVLEKNTENLRPVIERSIKNSVEDYAINPDATHTDLINEFRSLIPEPRIDDLWTAQDEEDLEQEAAGDSEFEHRCTYKDYMAFAWKTAYKFMGCLATDIVGPKTYLRFHSDHTTARNRYWADHFCQKLSTLIVQPVFEGSPGKLALAIQWTVICRTKDPRRWRLSGCDDEDEFLRVLKSVVARSHSDKKSPRRLRLAALDLFKRRYPTRARQDPIWNQFLQRIEEQAPKTPHAGQEADSQDFGDFDLYRVNTTDLANLLNTIPEVRVSGFPMFPDPTTVSMTALYTRVPTDLPLRPQVIEATRAALLSHRREARRAEKQGLLDGPASLGSSQSLGTQEVADDEQIFGRALPARPNISDQQIVEALAQISEEESEEADEDSDGEEPREAQTPRRITRQPAKKRVGTPVFTSSGDEGNLFDLLDSTPSKPTKKGPGRPKKQSKEPSLPSGWSIVIPVTSASERAEYETFPDLEDFEHDDWGHMDFGDIDLEESLIASEGDNPLKRQHETQPEELNPRPVKRTYSKYGFVINQKNKLGGQEQEQEQEQVRFLTGPYHEADIMNPVPRSLPSVPSNLSLADAIKQITSKRPGAGGTKHTVPKGKVTQDLKKVKRSMLNQVDWLEQDDPGYWLRNPLDCWPCTTK